MTVEFFEEEIDRQATLIEQLGGAVGHNPTFINKEMARISGAPFDEATVYPLSVKTEAEQIVRQKYLACLCLARCDRTRFGDIVDGFHNDFVGGMDRYPRTLTSAAAILYHSITKSTAAVDRGVLFAQDASKVKIDEKNTGDDKKANEKKGP